MAPSQIGRGFHRIGVALAILPLCLGLWLGFAAWRDSRPLPLCVGMFDDLIPERGGRPRCLQPAPGATDRGPWDLYRDQYTEAEVFGRRPDYTPAGLALAVAVALYAAAWAVGWIARGFIGA
jgi:hypothetical protein